MNKLEYNRLLSDSKWLSKRKVILKRDKQACKHCRSKCNLQVHHLYYIVDNKPWEYSNSCLVTLCDTCHSEWHDKYVVQIFCKGTEINGRKKYKAPTKQSWYNNKYKPKVKVIGKFKPTKEEIEQNNRSRSATLRVAEKL